MEKERIWDSISRLFSIKLIFKDFRKEESRWSPEKPELFRIFDPSLKPNTMKLSKLISWLGWASGIFGGLLMLGGVIGYITNSEFMTVRNYYNWFFLANSFILFGIFLVLGTKSCCCSCEKEEEKK